MQGRRTHLAPILSPEEYTTLSTLSRSQKTPYALVRRAQCILAVAQGTPISTAAKHYGISRQHLTVWLKRWKEHGIVGIQDRRRGRPHKERL